MILIGLGFGLKFLSDKVKKAQERQREEIEMLREKTQDQEKQIRDPACTGYARTEKCKTHSGAQFHSV